MSEAAKRPTAWFPIVGIGASAGGLEAVTRLLKNLPPGTGMAFVFIQHLDPTRKSLLPMILQKATRMPVEQAKDRMLIEPNHVYIIPPNAHMGVVEGRLRLTPRPIGISATSVTYFFDSLAEDRGNNAIAVVLSGSASDGALGLKAIKAEGGLVFAQDEGSAAHSGMPHSAAETGLVDFILPPEGIAAELANLSRHPVLNPDTETLFRDEKSLGLIFNFLKRGTGVDFTLYKSSTIRRRLMRRMLINKLELLAQYAALLAKDPDEVRALHDDLLIHVTHFFREPAALAVLRAKAFPRLLEGLTPDAPIRVWVAGCSTGEEVYTLAVLLLDFLSEHDRMNTIQIFATDISEPALAKARRGAYMGDIPNHVPLKLLRRYFIKTDRGYEIAKRVRDLCVFAKHDLTRDPPFANVDLISCCNVLIYLGAEAQKRVLPVFHYALRPKGSMILGTAETVGEFGQLFDTADKKCRLYYKKATASRLHFTPGALLATDPGRAAPKMSKTVDKSWPETDVQRVAERLLLARFAPAGLIIGSNLGILHFLGPANRYLTPSSGKASLSLLKMMPAHAAAPLRALIEKARKSDGPVKAEALELGAQGPGSPRTTVEAIPFRLPISGERYYILLFEDFATSVRGAKLSRAASPTPTPTPVAIKRLTEELAQTRTYLQSVVEEHEAVDEELKSANEEIISSNEELQSTNEELEIAKEELQAANEELTTLNEELQTRNGDLGQLNNDLTNLLSSVNLPIIMVSADLRIRRFTPNAEKVMNLIPADIGRSIGDIKPKIPLPNIEEIVSEVISSVTTKELEVKSGLRSFVVRVQPYKTLENKIEGAVLLFMPAEATKRSVSAIESVSAFEAALDIVREPLAVLDERMRVRAVSRSMYQAFGLSTSQLGRSIFELENGRWNAPELRAALEKLAGDGTPFSGLSVRIGKSAVGFSGRRVSGIGEGDPLILLGIDHA